MFSIDSLYDWWEQLPIAQREQSDHIQIKVDNGPESSGRRTQFLKRIVEFADKTGKVIQLLYYPPSHSNYNPIERCWGILEKHWKGARLLDAQCVIWQEFSGQIFKRLSG